MQQNKLVSTPNICEHRNTDWLENAEGGTSQDTEGNQLRVGKSLSGDGRGETSGHRKKMTEQGALTNWRWQGKGQVRKWREGDRARGTYKLETADGGTSQDTGKK